MAPIPRTENHASRQGTGVFPMLQDLLAINEHVQNACGELVRLGKGRMISNLIGVKHDNVSEISSC